MTIFLVIVGLSLLILLHEAGHFFAAKYFGLKVDEFGFGFPPRLFKWKKGETEYSFNLLPFGGFVKIAGETDRMRDDIGALNELPPAEKKRIFLFQPAWKRSVVILAGVVVNFIVGWLLISALFMIGGKQLLLISAIQPGSAAESAGLKAGDVVIDYTQSQAFIDYVNQNRGKQIDIKVIRNGQETIVPATPKTQTEGDEGALGVFLTEAGIPKYGFFRALYEGLLQSFHIAWLVVQTFLKLLENLFLKAQLLEGVVGPVGIFGVATEAGKIGAIYLLQLLALISLNLAVMNLIPFPALDGGRFFLILVEKIKGSPISPKIEGIINGIGFALLLILMVLITVRDVSRWF